MTLSEIESQLRKNPALVDAILSRPEAFPALQREPERIIRTSSANIQRAIARAFARCRERGEFWRIEVIEK